MLGDEAYSVLYIYFSVSDKSMLFLSIPDERYNTHYTLLPFKI